MSDVIYVNAGATEPLQVWLDALLPGGRLIFPLTPGWDYGGMLLVTRRDADSAFDAQFVTQVGFIPCLGAQDETLLPRLKAAFRIGLARCALAAREGRRARFELLVCRRDWWLSTATVH